MKSAQSPFASVTATYLIVLELPDSLILLSFSLSIGGVWPLANSSVGDVLKVLPVGVSHGNVVLILIGLTAHALDSFELIVTQDSGVFGGDGFLLSFGIGLAHSDVSSTRSE